MSVHLIVETIAVSDIYLNNSTVILEEDDSYDLTATITPEDASNKNVTWKSSDKNIALVNEDGNKVASCKVRVQFTDVTNMKSWEYTPIYWTADRGITTGAGGKFAPAGNCTREQAVTFLWRMWGSPAPKNLNSKFKDVTNKNSYSYKAIMWASENGIVTGANGRFAPTGKCLRREMVTFLYRYNRLFNIIK